MDLQDPKKILVVQIGKIGDMVLTTPLFSELKRIFPKSELIVLSSPVNKDIALNNDSVDRVIVFKKNLFANFKLFRFFIKKIDLWIDTKHNYSKTSALLVRMLKPRVSMGFNFIRSIFKITLNDHVIGEHAVNINLSPVNFINDEKKFLQLRPALKIPTPILNKFDPLFDKVKRNVTINVSAGNQSRYITKEKWLEVIQKISSKQDVSFKIIGLERDKVIIDFLLENHKSSGIKYLQTDNIIETAAAIKNSDFVITADTSIVHLCSAFNTPIVALFPGVKWNLNRFAPLSDHSEIITAGNKDSIEDINAEEVAEGYFRLVEKTISGNAESRTRVRKEDH